MSNWKSMLTAGVAVLAIGGGIWFYNADSPTVAQGETGQSSPPASASPSSQQSVAKDSNREKNEKIMIGRLETFDRKFSSFLKNEEKKCAGKRIEWRKHISADKSLPADVRSRNTAMWKDFLALNREYRELNVPPNVRMRFYAMMFDIDSFSPTDEERSCIWQPQEWDDIPFDYITQRINPSWYVAYADNTDIDFSKSEEIRAELPDCLKPYYDNTDDSQTFSTPPNAGIAHLVGYNKVRAEEMGGETLKVLKKHFGDLKGKDFADLGSGCGFTLPMFRECIGPNAKLYTAELNQYTMDVLRFVNERTKINAIVMQCKTCDCCLPENSVDILNMTGVHMGLFVHPTSQEEIDEKIIPWLKTMAKALRPGGVLTINDGNWDLVDRGLEKLVESAGFKKIDYIEAHEHSMFTFLFEVIK